MRRRNIHIQFWLNEKEAESFNRNVARSGLSREAYLRQMISGIHPRDAPPPDYFSMMKSLYAIGNNLNQIAVKAHTLNMIDTRKYDAAVRMLDDAIREITRAVVIPSKE